MTEQTAKAFLIGLTHLRKRHLIAGKLFLWMIPLGFVSLAVGNSSTIPWSRIAASVVIVGAVGGSLILEWCNMRLRCPNCGKRFIGSFRNVFPVHEIQKCHNCGTSVGQIEQVAGEQIPFVRRFKTASSWWVS